MKITHDDEWNFFLYGKLPPVPDELKKIAEIAAEAQKLGIEWSGRSIINVVKDIENINKRNRT